MQGLLFLQLVVADVDLDQQRALFDKRTGPAVRILERDRPTYFGCHLDLAGRRDDAVHLDLQVALIRLHRQRLDQGHGTRVLRRQRFLLARAERQHRAHANSDHRDRNQRTDQNVQHTGFSNLGLPRRPAQRRFRENHITSCNDSSAWFDPVSGARPNDARTKPEMCSAKRSIVYASPASSGATSIDTTPRATR